MRGCTLPVDLGIRAYAIAGSGSDRAPAPRCEPMPPPGTRRSGSRLGGLATALARRCVAAGELGPETGVLVGTGLGCLTETQAFVEHMVRAAEATPKPRAFAASVHNAIASEVARELGCRGECQTAVQGEVSFAHALLAAHWIGGGARLLVGALDEASPYVAHALRSCGSHEEPGEGGALLLLGDPAPVRVTEIALGRAAAATVPNGFEIAVPDLAGGLAAPAGAIPFAGLPPHMSLFATASALATGVLAGEIPASALGLDATPSALWVSCRGRLGDRARIRLEVSGG
ncbi:MAG: hypothetical protein KDC87_11425 [Planctomycetes bacterium]|nr:hypothetical protein [Planctomycetota bacterium]MCB9869785.1 hypothetical protein [Planctomycetota bacterium]